MWAPKGTSKSDEMKVDKLASKYLIPPVTKLSCCKEREVFVLSGLYDHSLQRINLQKPKSGFLKLICRELMQDHVQELVPSKSIILRLVISETGLFTV